MRSTVKTLNPLTTDRETLKTTGVNTQRYGTKLPRQGHGLYGRLTGQRGPQCQ